MNTAFHCGRNPRFARPGGGPAATHLARSCWVAVSGALRAMQLPIVFQRTLSVHCGVIITDVIDVHTAAADVARVEERLRTRPRGPMYLISELHNQYGGDMHWCRALLPPVGGVVRE